ncbi:MAG: exopolysaccharide biosynthesis polyprenyl glycosylphosphotransferase [Rhizomicrobium sp.]
MSVQEQFAEVRDALPVSFELASLRPKSITPNKLVRRTRILKRLLDLGIALLLLLFLSPALIAVAVLIKFDSRGPALFRQKRLGLNGRPFGIFKFRTMHVVEEDEAVVQAEPGDPRITRIGSFLRASSIDELPQLLNVILGQMSLIGPRPHAIAHDLHYAKLIPEYALRQSVKPGITGWAQVNGCRGGTPTLDLMQKRVDLDLWYAQNISIALDIFILARTPFELLRNRNVY